ncbi:transposon ty3-I gag-pol polyprotein [Tanacetum coccineum]
MVDKGVPVVSAGIGAGAGDIPQTRTSSGVRSTEEMDIAINDLNSKFASMSTVIEEIRSAIVGGGNHPNREGDERGIHRSRTKCKGFNDNHERNQPLKQVWRHDYMMSSDENEGEETMDEYNRGLWLVRMLILVGKRTVADYTGEFLRLQARCNLREIDEQSTARRKGWLPKPELVLGVQTWRVRVIMGVNPTQFNLPFLVLLKQPQVIKLVEVEGTRIKKVKRLIQTLKLDQWVPSASGVVNRGIEEDELEYAEPLDGEAEQVAYVIQRTLRSPKVSDSSQRNKIFQTKCLVKEKIVSIIIDGGSCENLVSKALVKAFKLPTEPHPNPYQIGWIKKGLTLKVTKICKVTLAIGKHYNELVTCDVVDMEACHVLLGRPWQHDVDATHQGKSNMYLFKWSGKTIAMLPLGVVSPKKALESKTLVTLVASPKQFQAERKEKRVSYALVVKGVEDFMENAIPAVVKPLLVEIG